MVRTMKTKNNIIGLGIITTLLILMMTATIPMASASVNLKEGLLAYFTFDEIEGLIAHDNHTNNYDGEANHLDVLESQTQGIINTSARLHLHHRIAIPDVPLNESMNFGISGWIKRTTSSTVHNPILAQRANVNSNRGLNIYINNNNLEVRSGWGSPSIVMYSLSNINQESGGDWFHLVVTQNDTNVQVYLNGTLVADVEEQFVEEPNALLSFGSINSGAVNNNKILEVDEFAIYQKHLTEEYVTVLFNEGQGLSYIDFEEPVIMGETSIDLNNPYIQGEVYFNVTFNYSNNNLSDVNYLVDIEGVNYVNQTHNLEEGSDTILINASGLSIGNYTVTSRIISEDYNETFNDTNTLIIMSLPNISEPFQVGDRTVVSITLDQELISQGNSEILEQGYYYRFSFEEDYVFIEGGERTFFLEELFIQIKSAVTNEVGEYNSSFVIFERDVKPEVFTLDGTIFDLQIFILILLVAFSLSVVFLDKWSFLLGSGVSIITVTYTLILFNQGLLSGIITSGVIGGILIVALVLGVRAISE